MNNGRAGMTLGRGCSAFFGGEGVHWLRDRAAFQGQVRPVGMASVAGGAHMIHIGPMYSDKKG